MKGLIFDPVIVPLSLLLFLERHKFFFSLSLQYIHHRLIHLTPADYDDFVNIIRSARGAFCLTPVGVMQFNDVLQNLKRGKQTKELWQRISLEMATFSP